VETVSPTPTAAQAPPPRKARHRLLLLDAENLTATCAICGPVQVYRRTMGGFMCATGQRARVKAYRETDDGLLAARRATIRSQRPYLAARKDTCERCGWSPLSERALCVHHRDENHGNDDASNLVTYCLGCHAEVHAQLQLQRDANARTPSADLVE